MFEPLAIETAFSHFVQSFANSSLDSFFIGISVLGHPALWFFLAAFYYWKGDEKKSFWLASTILFISAVIGVLKIVTARPRPDPDIFRVITPETGYALPSGHSAIASGMFGYYWEKFRRSARFIGLVIVVLVMLSRVYTGAHFLGDVIIGAFFGFLIGRMIHWAEAKYHGINFDFKRILEEAGLVGAIAAAVVVSIWLRPLSLASILLGYFAGFFCFKLLGMNSTKLAGKPLIAKEGIGFLVLAGIFIVAQTLEIEPEMLFLGGVWITLIYPAIYEMAIKMHYKSRF